MNEQGNKIDSYWSKSNSTLSYSINAWLRQSEQTLVVLVFLSSWSGSAHILTSYLSTILKEYPEVKMYQIDIEKMPDLAQQFGVSNIPTTAFMKNQKVVDILVGPESKKKLQHRISLLL